MNPQFRWRQTPRPTPRKAFGCDQRSWNTIRTYSSNFGSSIWGFWIHLLIVLHHLDMVLPFEVTCSADVFYFILLVLRKAPGGQILNVHEFLLQNILGYINICRFGDLQEAVYACLATRRNEVRLVRNVTWAANKSFENSKFKFKISESSNLRTC